MTFRTTGATDVSRPEAMVADREGQPLLDRLIDLMRDPASSVSQLGAVVSSDRALSERVLQQANSPVLGLPSRVSTVSQAVTLLGFEALRDTVMRMVVSGAFRTVVALITHYEDYWRHSIAVGLLARSLARRHGASRPEDAFVAGLFHDLGLVMPGWQQEGGDRPGDGPVAAGVEDDHAAAGARLAERWGLGERVAEAIRLHHVPGAAVVDPALVATVHVADHLSHRLDIGRYDGEMVTACDPGALACLGLTDEDLDPVRLAEESAVLRRDLAAAPAFDRLVASMRTALVDAIGTLPYQERLILALCYQEGLAMDDVAHLTGVSVAEVRDAHDAALATLASIIHDCV